MFGFLKRASSAPKVESIIEPETKPFLSLLPAEFLKEPKKLPKDAIAVVIEGKVPPGKEPQVKDVKPNPGFIRFMHRVIGESAPQDPTYRAEAARKKEGYVYIVDQRSPFRAGGGQVANEDIIGAFEIEDGQISEDTYKPNGKHVVYSERGLVRLPPFLLAAVIRELKALM